MRAFSFFAPHPALRAVVNNILVFHASTSGAQTKVTFPFPPLPEHCILFYPRDRPFSEDSCSKKLYHLHACTIAGQRTESTLLSLGEDHLMIKIGFQPGAQLYRHERDSRSIYVWAAGKNKTSTADRLRDT